MFSCELWEIFKNIFFYRIPPVAASDHGVETFIKATNNEINEEIAHIKLLKYSNLSKWQQKALEDLQEREDIVIVVIMDLTDYIEKAERQLNNKEHYHHLSNCNKQWNSQQCFKKTFQKGFKKKI